MLSDISPLLLTLPIISAAIGWVTNVIAIKSLFHPKEPIHFLGLTLHGVFPKRQDKIAKKLGSLVANELLSSDTINTQLTHQGTSDAIVDYLQPYLEDFIENAIREEKQDIGSRVIRHLLQHNKAKLAKKIGMKIPTVLQEITASEKFSTLISTTVSEKIRQFSSDELENLLLTFIKKELKWIEALGGILGFFIGCLQLGIVLYFNYLPH